LANRLTISGNVDQGVVIAGDHNTVYVYYERSEQTATASSPGLSATPLAPNPYKGLLYFEESDANRFFGREDLTEDLNQRFATLLNSDEGTLRILPVLGPSGSGKSSLLRAGLVPRLARERLSQLIEPRVAVLTPGAHPLEALARVLARMATGDPSPVGKTTEFVKELQDAPDGLRRIVDTIPGLGQARLVLVVDQFEELYVTPAAPAERQAFETERDRFIATLIDAATDRGSRLLALTAMRSDFLGSTQRNPVLNAHIARWGFIVPAMGKEELVAAIRNPAEQSDPPYHFDEAFIDLLVNETLGRPGALPLLQFTLQQVWDALPEDPADTLERLGGLGGAVAAEADKIFDRLSPEEKDIARRAFLAMVHLGEGAPDTRRRATLDEIVTIESQSPLGHAVLDRFARRESRLITLSQEPGRAVSFEVAHETLIRRWGKLEKWLDESRDDQRFLRRAREAASLSSKQQGGLWRPPDLDLLEAFARRSPGDMTEAITRFLEASQAEIRAEQLRDARQRLRLRIWSFAASILFLIAAVGSVYLAYQVDTARFYARTAQEQLARARQTNVRLLVEQAEQAENRREWV
jgi:hypothetical protein